MSEQSIVDNTPDTGSVVYKIDPIKNEEGKCRDGQFVACQDKQHLCGYACCGFGLGNWIFAFPGELEKAQEQGLTTGHLDISVEGNGHKIVCQRPCVRGEWKPIDCAIYPLWIAGHDKDNDIYYLITADNRKCPISQMKLFDKAREAVEVSVGWDQEHPGTLDGMVAAAKEYRAYVPFKYGYDRKNDTFFELTQAKLDEITPNVVLPDDFEHKYGEGYSAMSTPEDAELAKDLSMIPVRVLS